MTPLIKIQNYLQILIVDNQKEYGSLPRFSRGFEGEKAGELSPWRNFSPPAYLPDHRVVYFERRNDERDRARERKKI